MKRMQLRNRLAIAAMAAGLASALPQSAFSQETQYFPVASSRVGPYSAMGTGYYGAQIDYMNYVNMNGGVNGVMLTWQECETEYNAVKTVECYQRLLEKDGQKIVVFDTLGTPGAYAVINRMADDNVVLAQYGYGRTDGADGRVWPWVTLPLLVAGLGGGAVISPNFTLTLEHVPPRMGGAAGAAIQTGQRIGTAVGAALLMSAYQVSLAHGLAANAALRVALVAALVVQGCALVLAIVDWRRR